MKRQPLPLFTAIKPPNQGELRLDVPQVDRRRFNPRVASLLSALRHQLSNQKDK